MKFVVLLLVYAAWTSEAKGLKSRRMATHPVYNQTARDPRFLGIFNIVSFPNDECSADENQKGVCYTATECQTRGGVAGGSCAQGFGTCCVFTKSCTEGTPMITLENEVDYIENPNFPATDSGKAVCMLQIQPRSENICQVRLDFEMFELDAGSENKKPCDRDSLTVGTSGGVNVGSLCGLNTGRHLYLHLQNRLMPLTATLTLASRAGTLVQGGTMLPQAFHNISPGYKYRIKVSQLDCTKEDDADLIAPVGCSQYMTENSGIVSSYNFDPANFVQYPRNLDYTICFKNPSNGCQFQLRRDPSLSAYATSVGRAGGTTQPTAVGTVGQVGQVGTTDQYSAKNCGPDNGCGPEVCAGGIAVGRQATANPAQPVTATFEDYLVIPRAKRYPQLVQNSPTGLQMADDYYCGTGVGYDGGRVATTAALEPANGLDNGQGITSQVAGPVTISFHSDGNPGMRDGNTQTPTTVQVPVQVVQTNQPLPERDELGFQLQYNFLAACTGGK